MKRRYLNFLVLALLGFMIYGCNSGSNSVHQISLPAGSYNGLLTNMAPSECSHYAAESEIFISDGRGQLCQDSLCNNVNLATNPCLAFGQNNKSLSWSNCSFNSTTGIMTAIVHFNNTNVPFRCSGNLTLTLQNK